MQILLALAGLVWQVWQVDGRKGQHLLINIWLAKARKCNNIFRFDCADSFCLARSLHRAGACQLLVVVDGSVIIKNQLARLLLFLEPPSPVTCPPLGCPLDVPSRLPGNQNIKWPLDKVQSKLSLGFRPLMSCLGRQRQPFPFVCLHLELEHLFIIIIGPHLRFHILWLLGLWVVYGNRFSANIFSFVSI